MNSNLAFQAILDPSDTRVFGHDGLDHVMMIVNLTKSFLVVRYDPKMKTLQAYLTRKAFKLKARVRSSDNPLETWGSGKQILTSTFNELVLEMVARDSLVRPSFVTLEFSVSIDIASSIQEIDYRPWIDGITFGTKADQFVDVWAAETQRMIKAGEGWVWIDATLNLGDAARRWTWVPPLGDQFAAVMQQKQTSDRLLSF